MVQDSELRKHERQYVHPKPQQVVLSSGILLQKLGDKTLNPEPSEEICIESLEEEGPATPRFLNKPTAPRQIEEEEKLPNFPGFNDDQHDDVTKEKKGGGRIGEQVDQNRYYEDEINYSLEEIFQARNMKDRKQLEIEGPMLNLNCVSQILENKSLKL